MSVSVELGSRTPVPLIDDLQVLLSRKVAQAGDLHQLVTALCEALAQRVVFDQFSLAVRDDGDTFRLTVTWGSSGWRFPEGDTIDMSGFVGWRDLLRGRPVRCQDLVAGAVQDAAQRRLAARGVASFVSVPVVTAGEVVALFNVSSLRADHFSAADVAAVERLVHCVEGAVTVHLLLERERAVTRQLQQLQRAREAFLGMVAHDLRSPLTVIAGFAHLLSRNDLDSETRRRSVEAISGNAVKLSRLTDDLLQAFRLEAGEGAVKVRPCDLESLVWETTGELAVTTGRECEVDVAGSLPRVLADPQRQWQILSNVLNNALEYSPADRSVQVRLSYDRARDEVVVAVTDHGTGIDEDDLTRLLEPFFRGRRPGGAEEESGTGLGLYICRLLVEAQGGRITVESATGVGTTVRWTVPVHPAPARVR